MQLFIASSNRGKIQEIQSILHHDDLVIRSVLDTSVPPGFDVDETGATLQENAWLKARGYAELTGLPTLADDSGLEVTALNGFPGIYANRWFPGTSSERNQALLAKLGDHPDRRAAFRSVLCFFDPHTQVKQFFEGEIQGTLVTAERGSKMEGFGYDPIFIPDGYDQSFAEMGQVDKNKISHRRQALFKLKQYLFPDTHLVQPE